MKKSDLPCGLCDGPDTDHGHKPGCPCAPLLYGCIFCGERKLHQPDCPALHPRRGTCYVPLPMDTPASQPVA